MGNSVTKFLTIFTDASFDDRYSCGGWGAWAISDGRSVIDSGPLSCVTSTTIAELRACLEGFRMAQAQNMIADRHIVIIQSDSMAALGAILALGNVRDSSKGLAVPKRHKFSAEEHEILKEIWNITGAKTVLTRHRTGRDLSRDGRNRVNKQVDRLARRHMHALRKELSA